MRIKAMCAFLAAGTLLLLSACAGAAPAAVSPAPEPVQEEPQQTGDVKLTVKLSPDFFSPDGDGQDDALSIALGVANSADAARIASWTFDIQDPAISQRAGQPVQIMKHFEGTTLPADPLSWDGAGDPRTFTPPAREGQPAPEPREFTPRVQSATEYPYVFAVKDAAGETIGTYAANLFVDIMVRETEDGKLRILVPSIWFRPNGADFDGLDERIVQMNERVVLRVAAAIKRYPETYKIRIEGHANPENAPGTAARAKEEAEELKANSVSEQRAKKIMEMLETDGIAKNRMTAVGMGVSQPIADFENQDRVWVNRRVEFYLEK